MKLISLSVRNYRSIQTLDWKPGADFVCLLGKGDVGKSTILDAVEAVLSPKRTQFFDTDFFNCNVDLPIEITALVGELPDEACEEGRMGMYLQGMSATGETTDEPKKDSLAVVTVKLTVDKDLEPKWELVNSRADPKALYSKDRALFGLVRLGAETDAHLTWGQYSPLARLSEQKGGASNVLTKAFRKAKDTVRREPIKDLNDAAAEVRLEAIRLGAYPTKEFEAGLDTQRLLSSLSGLSLHSSEVPIRMSGLGSRRLTSLAIQRLSVPSGAIVLIDELEHGLEPHRIRHAIKLLREEVMGDDGSGQVILTTHSPTAIVELKPADLGIALRDAGGLKIVTPSSDLQRELRGDPEAFLSRKVIVSEGKTEVGLLRALRKRWADAHEGESLAYRGVALADGEGSSGCAIACKFAELGYPTCLFRDSDVELTVRQKSELGELSIPVFEWPGKRATEEQVFSELSADGVQELLEYACDEFTRPSVLASVSTALGVTVSFAAFREWISSSHPESVVRQAMAKAAGSHRDKGDRKGWFKRIDRGEKLGQVIDKEIGKGLNSDLTRTLSQVEAWAYAE